MTRIQKLFSTSKAKIAYLTIGDGGRAHSLQAALALIRGGVNMLELGMPFSDPVADGPVIQQASARALKSGTTLADLLWIIIEIRKHSDIPLVLFSYLNPLFYSSHHHARDYLSQTKSAGLDALLLVDCPLEVSYEIKDTCSQLGLDLIYVITPNTPVSRIKKINEEASGFLYYACRKGTTGLKPTLPVDLKEKIQQIKSLSDLPIVVGFGISTLSMAKQVLNCADGVVVGSYFVKLLAEGASPSQLTSHAQQIFL